MSDRIAHRIDEVDGYSVLTLSGELSLVTAIGVQRVLRTLLLDRGTVFVDVSALRVSWLPALGLFPSLLSHCGGWPSARLVLIGADERLVAALSAVNVTDTLTLASGWMEAKIVLRTRPERVSREIDLPPTPDATILARETVHTACEEWGLEALSSPATVIATELAANAVEHARTPSRLTCTLGRRSLRISVRDWTPLDADADPSNDRSTTDNYGLLLVRGMARRWGVTPHDDGKTVWAFLRTVDAREGAG